ncbi:unnamed protein product [Thelazia callipaeda]|uniref:VOC domain-containing protein n=1 Tax=Thelazia callipaeda TaxID=103827 RepID=A0A0N5CLP3_THECL|nr:unnamed protein product [Thelazia callipaeda]
MTVRALHYVFKIADRKKSRDFFVNVLKMKVLRHEEFDEGCKALCNGPYDGKWSKTMVGYGSEDNHFVIELTYNYPINSYKLGNDFEGICIRSKDVFENCKVTHVGVVLCSGEMEIEDPDGHRFYISPSADADPIYKVKFNTPDIKATMGTEFFHILSYSSLYLIKSFLKQLVIIKNFLYSLQLEKIQKKMEDENQKILTSLKKLDTPGKASVQVVILADPNGHEICFVGDEAFRELSQTDPNADQILLHSIEKDKSAIYKRHAF